VQYLKQHTSSCSVTQPNTRIRHPTRVWVTGSLVTLFRRVTAAIAEGKRPVPFRTRKLSPPAPMVLHSTGCGRVGHRRTQHLRMPLTTRGQGHSAFETNTNTTVFTPFVELNAQASTPAPPIPSLAIRTARPLASGPRTRAHSPHASRTATPDCAHPTNACAFASRRTEPNPNKPTTAHRSLAIDRGQTSILQTRPHSRGACRIVSDVVSVRQTRAHSRGGPGTGRPSRQ
jgi:hypothetical protein